MPATCAMTTPGVPFIRTLRTSILRLSFDSVSDARRADMDSRLGTAIMLPRRACVSTESPTQGLADPTEPLSHPAGLRDGARDRQYRQQTRDESATSCRHSASYTPSKSMNPCTASVRGETHTHSLARTSIPALAMHHAPFRWR
jgi:hypothetical protein